MRCAHGKGVPHHQGLLRSQHSVQSPGQLRLLVGRREEPARQAKAAQRLVLSKCGVDECNRSRLKVVRVLPTRQLLFGCDVEERPIRLQCRPESDSRVKTALIRFAWVNAEGGVPFSTPF